MFCIADLLRARAEETPQAVAVTAPGRASLTYGRLFSQVERVVQALNDLGIGRNDRVGIVLPNGPEMATAFLSIAAGAVSAPLNPGYRAGEFEYYLSDLGAKVLCVQMGVDSPAIEVANKLGIPVIALRPEIKGEAGIFTLTGEPCAGTPIRGFATPEETALVLHTSGTTSRPKIVPLTHTNLCVSADNIQRALELSPSDRCLNVMPLFHIHGLVGGLLSSLSAGGQIICTAGFYAPKFSEWLETLNPSWYTAVPTMHQAILARAAAGDKGLSCARLRFIRSCSAPLPPRVMAELEELFHAPVIEAYGMTEAAHQMTSNCLPPRSRKPGSVGVSTGIEVAVADSSGVFVPQGQPGEIVIRGASLMSGYEGNVEANQDAFTNSWFRTGDQGYLDDEGYLFLTGRLKEMINRGGSKIAPREIDEVLLQHPAVSQAVAFAIPHSMLGEDVAAAVVMKKETTATERELREYVAARLADFKVPRRIIMVDEIPKGPTGKLQRIGLAERLGLAEFEEEQTKKRSAANVAPRTPLEEALARMWREVLGIEQLSVLDDFFDVGGDSMLGTQLYVRVCETMQVQLSLVRFFETATVEGQAQAIAEGRPGTASPSLIAIQPSGDKAPFFCIPAAADLLGLTDLARLLGPEQPFYALYPGALLRQGAPYTVESAAAHYLDEIRRLQPSGPYLLGASCAGCGVALELASQFRARGENIDLLVLIDPVLHGRVDRTIRSYWKSIAPLPPREKLSSVLGTARNLTRDIPRTVRHKLSGMRSKAGRIPDSSAESAPQDVREVNRQGLSVHARRVYPGRMAIFLTDSRPEGLRPSLDPRHVWARLATGGLEIHVVPGDHDNLLHQPHVAVVAQKLSACLDSVKSSGQNLSLS